MALDTFAVEKTQKVLLDIPEAAAFLGIGKTKMYALAASGDVAGVVKVGRLVKLHRPTLERWLEEQAQGHSPER